MDRDESRTLAMISCRSFMKKTFPCVDSYRRVGMLLSVRRRDCILRRAAKEGTSRTPTSRNIHKNTPIRESEILRRGRLSTASRRNAYKIVSPSRSYCISQRAYSLIRIWEPFICLPRTTRMAEPNTSEDVILFKGVIEVWLDCESQPDFGIEGFCN